MPVLRSRPLLIAPLIPLWGILGLIATERLHGSPFMAPFVVLWTLLLAALFAYVASQAMRARRMRTNR
ncbi:MAG: hypothetical protein ACRYFU_10620 [Janthinobacterium lividum]